jgi:hypothetical protein
MRKEPSMPFDDPTANALAQVIREAFPVPNDSEARLEILGVSPERFRSEDFAEAVGEGLLAVLFVLSHTTTDEAWALCGHWLLSFSSPELHRKGLAAADQELREAVKSGDPEFADLLELVQDFSEEEWEAMIKKYRRRIGALSGRQRHILAEVLDWCHARAKESELDLPIPWESYRDYAQAIRDFRETP